MKKATYEQLVKVAVEYANNNNCSYALAAKLYKSQKEMCLRLLSHTTITSRPQRRVTKQQGQQCPTNNANKDKQG
jgi:hypothetical protein